MYDDYAGTDLEPIDTGWSENYYQTGDNSGAPTASDISDLTSGSTQGANSIQAEAGDPAMGLQTPSAPGAGSGSSIGGALSKALAAAGLGGGNNSNSPALQAALGLLSAYGKYKSNAAGGKLPAMPALPGMPGTAGGSAAGYGPAGGYNFANYGKGSAGLGSPATKAATPPANSYFTYGSGPEQQFFQQVTGGAPIAPVHMATGGRVPKFDDGGLMNTGNSAQQTGQGPLAPAAPSFSGMPNSAQQSAQGPLGGAPMPQSPKPMIPPPAPPPQAPSPTAPQPSTMMQRMAAARPQMGGMRSPGMGVSRPFAEGGIALSDLGKMVAKYAKSARNVGRDVSENIGEHMIGLDTDINDATTAAGDKFRKLAGYRPGNSDLDNLANPFPGGRNALGVGYAQGGRPDANEVANGMGALSNVGQSRHVTGPGDGTSDSIPARLANGEYVIDAQAVSMLGNGDNSAGAKRLDEFRKNLRQHKGGALSKGKMAPNAKPIHKYMGGQ